MALVVMFLPIAGFYFLGIYQSALVRQTERQLIATGDVTAAQYRAALRLVSEDLSYRELCGAIGSPAYRAALMSGDRLQCYGLQMAQEFILPRNELGELVINRQPRLDLAVDPIQDRLPDPVPVARLPRPAVEKAALALQETVRDTHNYTLAGVRLLDHTGQIIASSNPSLIGKSLEHIEEVQRTLRGEPMSVLRAKLDDPPAPPIIRWFRPRPYRVHVAMPITHEGRVLGLVYLSRTPTSIRSVLINKWPALTFAIALVLLIVLLLTLGASLLLVRPVRALVLQAEDAAKGVKGAVTLIRQPGTHEIASLSSAITTMAHRLEERANYIEGFAAQVSHEFKTPLTSIQGAVELLREHGDDMTEADQQKFLKNVASDSLRLEMLVNRLLELARADTMETQKTERADLSATLIAAQERSLDRGQPVALMPGDALEQPLWVALGPDTLASVILNMLDNAYQHAGPETEVLMEVRQQPGAVRLLVADKGPGITSANSGQIFAPFFTTARKEGGTGLGLSLVRSLLQSCGGSIALTPPPAGYATAFSLSIPHALSVQKKGLAGPKG